jgi:hypothetical protein
MLSPNRRFQIHGVTDVEKWASDHYLEPFAHPCTGCGAELRTSIPFGWRTHDGRVGYGLTAPHCACGVHDRADEKGWTSNPPYCVHLDDFPGANRT